jgi:hypothetical protein
VVAAAAVSVPLLATSTSAHAENWIGRSVTLAGRNIACGKAEIMIDRDLPSEGGAGDDFLILNPDMLNQQPSTVRLFVFSHECGHLTVGDSELDADCWAVGRGVREGWLDRKGLRQVCASFEGAPETDTHPSAARRCANLDRCYAAALDKQRIQTAMPTSPKPGAAKEATTAGPMRGFSVRNSVVRTAGVPELPVKKRAAIGSRKELSAWRCAPPDLARSGDPIAGLIEKDKDGRCR